ncbi:hypothetical protein RFI_25730, partial [Reticulomyxa filosa]
MKGRLEKLFSDESKWNLAIILAGTNDLAFERDYKKICDALLEVHQTAWKHNCYTISMTVPESDDANENKQFITRRNLVNDYIRSEISNRNKYPYAFAVFDLNVKVPYNNFKHDYLTKDD